MRDRIFAALAILILACNSTSLFAYSEFADDLIDHQIGTVITASKAEQSINQAPATMTVITSKEIKDMGALSIPEILQYVPGLEVTAITSSHAEVSIRGFNQVPSNNVLVMIDGRSVYTDYFGGTVWESLPILIEQIDRIEIMRSPGSAVYGANAFCGVINILTKTPNQLSENQVFFKAGELATVNSGVIVGRTKGSTGLRLAAGAKKTNSFSMDDDPSEKVFLANLLIEKNYGQNTRLFFDSGLSHGFVHKIFLDNPNKSDESNIYSKIGITHGDYSLQAYWNRGSQDENTYTFSDFEEIENISFNTFNVEAQGRNYYLGKNSILYGIEYRLNSVKSSILDDKHLQKLSSVFFENETRITPALTYSLGARIDKHPLVGTAISPRSSLIYSVNPQNTLRVSFSKAFRNPTYLNSYLIYKSPLEIYYLGNENLSSEKISSLEAAYVFTQAKNARIEFSVFGNKMKDCIFLDPAGVFDFDTFTTQKTFFNQGSASIFGSEINGECLLGDNIKIAANYCNQHIRNRITVVSGQRPPVNKASVKVSCSWPYRLTSFFGLNYMDKMYWTVPTHYGVYEVMKTDSRVIYNCRIGYTPRKLDCDLFCSVFNLFGTKKRDYPLAEETKRRVVFGAYYYF